MRINYTLPGYAPETDVGKDVVESFDSPFRNRMHAFEQQQPVGWKELLGLDAMPPDTSQVAEPHAEAATLGQQWRDFLNRHAGPDEFETAPDAVRRMLDLLHTYQREADEIFSRGM